MSLSVIIDYKVGNLHNLKNALDYLKLPVAIVEEPECGLFAPVVSRTCEQHNIEFGCP